MPMPLPSPGRVARTASSSALRPLFPAFLALTLCSCGGGQDPAGNGNHRGGDSPNGGAAERTVPVAVEYVSVGTASSYYTSTAVLEPRHHAEILSRTTGVVREILREEGDAVQAGEVLLVLEDNEARLRLQEAQVNLEQARGEHVRRVSLREMGILSDEEFETAENALRLREVAVDLAELELSHTRVRAPFAGRVVRREVDLGANVSPGAPLFEMMAVEPLLARVHVPAGRMGFITPGQEMKIALDSDGTQLAGVVSLVSPIVDPASGTVKVTAEIHDYPADTRPGDFASVRIVTARHPGALLVPSPALFEEQGENVLFVASLSERRAERRVVEAGFVDGEMTEILGGVEAGELIVVKGQRQLHDGMGIEILEGPPDVLAALERVEPPDSGAVAPDDAS